jgi:apolipoprotein N-acyltransferase
LVGIEGLSFVAIILFATPAVLVFGQGRVSRFAISFLAIALIGIVALYGLLRLATAPDPANPAAYVPDIRIRIMQPNLTQAERNRTDSGEALLKSYLELSDRATSPDASGLADVTLLVWPESPFPFLLSETPEALRMIGEALPENTTLVTGAVRLDREAGSDQSRYFNTMHVIDHTGTITESYDKLHLVPFGEYLPAFADRTLRSIGLRQFVTTPGGFAPGSIQKTMTAANAPPFLPLICYEAIFPITINSNLPKTSWLLNVTNDAWFGETFGPRQHAELARLRAIETGLPLLRAANSGVSVVFDPFGRAIHQLDVGVRAVLDSPLPQATGATLRLTYGRTPIWGMLIFSFLICTFALIRKR